MVAARLLALLAVLWASTALAELYCNVVVNYRDGQYVVDMDARLDAPEPAVRALFTDYDHLERINPAIERSEVLSRSPDILRVRTEIRSCVWFFCRQVHQVQDVNEAEDGSITAVTVPELSDFRSGHTRFHFWQEPQGTRVLVRAELSPDFWIPPLIGPWLIRRKLHAEILQTMQRVNAATTTTVPGNEP